MVRKYQLYSIEDEFASHYFGRERMFFQLFLEHERTSGELKMILKKQIHYITKPMQALRFHQLIQQHLGGLRGFQVGQGSYTYMIELNGRQSHAELEIYDKMITVKARGSYEAETVFFEVLRKYESSFLAVDLEHNRFGWLKPIKERKFV